MITGGDKRIQMSYIKKMRMVLPGLKRVLDHFPVFLLLALFFNTILYAQTGSEKYLPIKKNAKKNEIVFTNTSWGDAVKIAAKNHKYIFVDAYASWCGPCKLLKSTTFQDKEAANFFNENFINLSIDMEKGEGADLAALWQVQTYPTMIIFDSSGKPVLGTVGFLEPNDLIKFGKQALDKKTEQ